MRGESQIFRIWMKDESFRTRTHMIPRSNLELNLTRQLNEIVKLIDS